MSRLSLPHVVSGYCRGLTLVELALVIGLVGILAISVPPLVLQGSRSFMFLPRSQLVNRTALEVIHACVEGSFSTLTGQALPGLRYAARQSSPLQNAIWIAEDQRVGFLLPHNPATTADNQYVLLRLDGESIKRSIYSNNACSPPSPSSEEVIPYDAVGVVRVLDSPSRRLFRYYDTNGMAMTAPGCGAGLSSIRRIDIAFVAQTGAGNFDQADARVDVTSSIAIRFP